ncbi:ABC transporter ATP-binding protein [Acetobacterium woodii]|uniref:ABC transport system ATP-binding protein n=1 Tax=Acetobacterium woodii (strain ATCC 29683 / DSM 1030 / JCM 2381 / KCTC 1655 / WB1) TaxID=931626 RepID=H6LCK9_ACEWD|nr:ABC transporter ATP-binding protein [Acetobacterium woodii]AFA47791.1 ABC transport system ATP-binding protein [Acetobacterium woodii DSM 1030]
MDILQICNLKKTYRKKISKTNVVETMAIDKIDFRIESGSFISIMGKSGCGKTTLLKLIGGLDTPTEGEILYKGQPLAELSHDQLAQYRREQIGFVFQDYNLMDSLTIKENIMLPMLLDNKKLKEIEKSVICFTQRFGIRKHLNKYPGELSGGEQQRVSICRALSNNPKLILADEPTGNLDSKSSKEVVTCLKELNQELRKTVILVTHDPYIASFADEVLLLKDGKIERRLVKYMEKDQFFKILIEHLNVY